MKEDELRGTRNRVLCSGSNSNLCPNQRMANPVQSNADVGFTVGKKMGWEGLSIGTQLYNYQVKSVDCRSLNSKQGSPGKLSDVLKQKKCAKPTGDLPP